MPVVYLVDKFSVAELTEVGRSLLEEKKVFIFHPTPVKKKLL